MSERCYEQYDDDTLWATHRALVTALRTAPVIGMSEKKKTSLVTQIVLIRRQLRKRGLLKRYPIWEARDAGDDA